MQRILIFIILFNYVLFAQKIFQRNHNLTPVTSDVRFEVHQLKMDSANTFFSSKISFDKIFFVKSGNVYLSNVKINLEVRDSLQNVILRKTLSNTVTADNYEETNSTERFIENTFQLNLSDGKYSFLPSIENTNNLRVTNFPEIIFRIDSKKLFYEPIVASLKNATDNKYLFVKNYGGKIPFSNSPFALLIPLSEKITFPVSVVIKQKDSVIYRNDFPNFSGKYSLMNTDGKLILSRDTSGIAFLLISEVISKLNEGMISIETSNALTKETFSKQVVWFDKPYSLRDNENAVELLKIIEKESVVEKMLDEDEENYQQILFRYWNKFDPDTTNSFNEVMEEFYRRVDEADRNYSVFDKKKGSDTDRGIIFIKYGKPDQIIRSFTEIDSTKEIWVYKSLNLQFSFIDNSGTGSFVLQK